MSSEGGVVAGRPCLGPGSVVDVVFCAVLAGGGLPWRPGHGVCAVGLCAALTFSQLAYLLMVGVLGGDLAGWQCLSCVALGNGGFCAVVAGGGSLCWFGHVALALGSVVQCMHGAVLLVLCDG